MGTGGEEWPLVGLVSGKTQSMQVAPFQNNFLCLGVAQPWHCNPFNLSIAVGPGRRLAIQGSPQDLADNAENSAAIPCSTVTGPDGPVAAFSPYSLTLYADDGFATQSVRQIGDSTWRITLSAANTSPANGCNSLTFAAGVTNLTNADNSQAMIVTINPDSTQPYQSDGNTLCDFNGITIEAPPNQMSFSGSGLAPQAVTVPMAASAGETTTEASIVANINGFANFVQACTLDFNVQLTGSNSSTSTTGVQPTRTQVPSATDKH